MNIEDRIKELETELKELKAPDSERFIENETKRISEIYNGNFKITHPGCGDIYKFHTTLKNGISVTGQITSTTSWGIYAVSLSDDEVRVFDMFNKINEFVINGGMI